MARSADHALQGFRWGRTTIGIALLPVLLFLAATYVTARLFSRMLNGPGEPMQIVALLVALALSAVPIVICRVQATAKRRQIEKLDSISGSLAATTYYFLAARTTISTIHEVRFSANYTMPFITFSAVLLFSSLLVLMSPFAWDSFASPNFLLAGMKVSLAGKAGNFSLPDYQRGTFAVMAMAFVGSYVYTLYRLLDRLNNNDFYPISFYYFAVRIIVALLISAVFRHAADGFGLANGQTLALIGFTTGLAPDLFILAMARKAFQAIKVFGSKDEPKEETRPRALPLLMLDDLTKEKVDRLDELGIDSAQILACQNPFMLWPRLPYDLGLIVDWIAEAQLYTLVREGALQALRQQYVNDIFDLHVRLSDAAARDGVCRALGIEAQVAPALLRQLEDDQSFVRLLEVRDGLLPARPAFPAVS